MPDTVMYCKYFGKNYETKNEEKTTNTKHNIYYLLFVYKHLTKKNFFLLGGIQ